MLPLPLLILAGRRAVTAFREDGLGILAAALAFAAFASLFPLLLLLVAAAGFVLPAGLAERWVVQTLLSLAPRGADTGLLLRTLSEVIQARGTGTGLAAVISVLSLVITASGGFHTLRTAFNRIGGRPRSENMIRDRLLAGALLAGVLPVLILSTASTAILHGLQQGSLGLLGAQPFLWQMANLLASLGLFTLLLTGLFYTLRGPGMRWVDVWPAALFTALLWEALKQGFAIYLGHSVQYAAVYGALGGLLALQTWIFLCAQVLLFGGELAVVYAALRQERAPRPAPRVRPAAR